MNIILIGFRGTGKTTIGRILAQRLGKVFIDADEYLEQREKKTIRDIFTEDGEDLFRDIEVRIIEELCRLNDTIIATGGGVILREENVRRLKRNGIVILLEADVNTIYKRIYENIQIQHKRPNLTNLNGYQEIEYLLAYRRSLYDKAADFVFDTTVLPINDTVNKIIAFTQNYIVALKNCSDV
ncbi:MAG: shikimate kinase [Candidatus Jettenia sp. CY-1]|nr:MAG: shikimate kinase [Candidatus Jettenia sp. CY-1]